MRAYELVSKLSKLPMPCVEGRRHQEYGVGRYVATVRVGGQLARTVVYADSTVHARLLLQYKYGMKSIAVAPVQVDESTGDHAVPLLDGAIKRDAERQRRAAQRLTAIT